MRNIKCVLLTINLLLVTGLAWGAPAIAGAPDTEVQAPLVQDTDATKPSAATIDTSRMSVGERVARLEQMVAAQGQLQILNQLGQMQQQIEILQGQNEVLRHQLDQLQTQQRSLYADLNQRVTALEGGNKVTPAVVSAAQENISDQDVYQQAYNLMVAKQYEQALTALQNFVKQYPQSTYVPNALYWQGEIYAMQNKPDQAKIVFQQLLQQYPNDAKAPDAKFRLATMAADNNRLTEARAQLNAIIKQYPNSSTATLATAKLRQLKGQ
jgi:tol-pal system protein YbgF